MPLTIHKQENMELEATVAELSIPLQKKIGKPPTTKIKLIVSEEQPLPNFQTSKWAKLVERNRNTPLSLGKYTDQDESDRKEFRENFTFKHDH